MHAEQRGRGKPHQGVTRVRNRRVGEQALEVVVSVFNQAVNRNMERFPADFAFQLTRAVACRERLGGLLKFYYRESV